jgi:hypothetical protein
VRKKAEAARQIAAKELRTGGNIIDSALKLDQSSNNAARPDATTGGKQGMNGPEAKSQLAAKRPVSAERKPDEEQEQDKAGNDSHVASMRRSVTCIL